MSRNDDQDSPYLSTDDNLPDDPYGDDPYGFDQDSSFRSEYADEDSGITIIDPARRQRRTLTRALIAICVMVVLALLLWLFGTDETPEPERTASAPAQPNEPTLILPPLPPLTQDGGMAADGDLALPTTDLAQASAPEEAVADDVVAPEPEVQAEAPAPEAPMPEAPAPLPAPAPVPLPPPAPVAAPEPAAPATFEPAAPPAPAPAPAPAAKPPVEPAAPPVKPAPPEPPAAKAPAKAAAAAPAPAAQPKAEPQAAPAPKEGGAYAVRIGEFMPLNQAQSLLKDVLTQKESAAIQQRVTVGSFPNRAAARAEQARLAQNGHGDSVIVRGDNGFTVQLGVFSRASNAERLEQQLRAAGFDVNSAARVTVGPYASRAEAEQALAKIRNKNSVTGQIISTR